MYINITLQTLFYIATYAGTWPKINFQLKGILRDWGFIFVLRRKGLYCGFFRLLLDSLNCILHVVQPLYTLLNGWMRTEQTTGFFSGFAKKKDEQLSYFCFS